jgi:hypothetical protein
MGSPRTQNGPAGYRDAVSEVEVGGGQPLAESDPTRVRINSNEDCLRGICDESKRRTRH